MRKIIAISLIVVGLVLISIPYLGQIMLQYKLKNNQDLFDSLSADDLRENESLEADYDYSLIRDLEAGSIFSQMSESYGKAMVGQVTVPDLDINLPILKGTTNANLLVGATTMVGNQKMGQDNYPLAGHYRKYQKDKSQLFGRLLEIQIGTLVKMTDKEKIYEYKIYDTKLVPDTATNLITNMVSEERGKPVVSLMTCYYTSKNGKRFFALGELVDEYPYEEDKMN